MSRYTGMITPPSDPHFSDEVTFAVTTDGPDPTWVYLSVTQAGQVVATGVEAVTGGESGPFALGPTELWTGGAASAVATLFYGSELTKHDTVATVAFEISA